MDVNICVMEYIHTHVCIYIHMFKYITVCIHTHSESIELVQNITHVKTSRPISL